MLLLISFVHLNIISGFLHGGFLIKLVVKAHAYIVFLFITSTIEYLTIALWNIHNARVVHQPFLTHMKLNIAKYV